VYAVPAVNPVKTYGLDEAAFEEVAGEDVTVYPVIADPPVAPAVNGIDTDVGLAIVTVPIVGACGTVVGVTEDDALDAVEAPLALAAVTV
jgi:hypothetical protein